MISVIRAHPYLHQYFTQNISRKQSLHKMQLLEHTIRFINVESRNASTFARLVVVTLTQIHTNAVSKLVFIELSAK